MNVTLEQITAMLKTALTVDEQGAIIGIEAASEKIIEHLEKLFCRCGEYELAPDKALTFCNNCGRLHKWIPNYE